jgi:glyoxylase-like metal-dependent hydrolase (beta-lactamase superfamily II)
VVEGCIGTSDTTYLVFRLARYLKQIYSRTVILRPFLYPGTACASYLFGCLTHKRLAVVDPHAHLVDAYLDEARAAGAPIVAVVETHVQADHRSGLPALVEETGATPYLPASSGVALAFSDAEAFSRALLAELPPPPADQAEIVAANRSGRLPTPA